MKTWKEDNLLLTEENNTYRVSIVEPDSNGITVLPADWDDPEDDIYESLLQI